MIALIFIAVFFSNALWGRTNQPLYEDPFDIGAGGTTLTRATQESMLINNPALLPYGGKFFRWLGLKSNISAAKDSIDLVKSLAQGDSSASQSESNGNNLINSLFTKPIHFGASQSASFITNNGGICAFASVEPDFRAFKRGDPKQGSGVPSVVVRNEVYGGLYASLASRSLYDWFAYGFSAKYLMIGDNELRIDLTDQDAPKRVQTELGDIQNTGLNKGIGFDFSTLFFWQGRYVDARLASVMNDLGSTKLSGQTGRTHIPQTLNVGLGLTFHTSADAIHFSADLRDVSNAYEQELFKRLYLGTRILIRTWVGIAFGIYHGSPTYGIELDLFLFRASLASYTREYGDHPLVDQRKIYVFSFTTGLAF